MSTEWPSRTSSGRSNFLSDLRLIEDGIMNVFYVVGVSPDMSVMWHELDRWVEVAAHPIKIWMDSLRRHWTHCVTYIVYRYPPVSKPFGAPDQVI